MVILIIAALMALILPAINGARRSARNAAVKAELTRLDTAIAGFKARYNVNPPSFLAIPPVGDPWTAGYASSKRALRRIWPQFNFATNGGLGNSEPVILSGAECLVLFLGGVPNAGGALNGFSKNPRTPFAAIGENRDGPFYEFDSGRLVDVDGDSVAEYLDDLPGQQTPLLYVSFENGAVTQTEGAPDSFDVFNNNDVSSATSWSDSAGNNLAGPYHQDAALQVAWKKDSYQLISPGLDGAYGALLQSGTFAGKFVGNRFYKADADNLPRQEADNISNFNTGSTMGG